MVVPAGIVKKGEELDNGEIGTSRFSQQQHVLAYPRPMGTAMRAMPID